MLADRLARTPVRDVLLQCMATFVDMAGRPARDGPRRRRGARPAAGAPGDRGAPGAARRRRAGARGGPGAGRSRSRSPSSRWRSRGPARSARIRRRGGAADRRPRRPTPPRASGCRRALPAAKARARRFPGSGRLGRVVENGRGRPNRHEVGRSTEPGALALDRAYRRVRLHPISEGLIGRLPVGQHSMARRGPRLPRRGLRHRPDRLPAQEADRRREDARDRRGRAGGCSGLPEAPVHDHRRAWRRSCSW